MKRIPELRARCLLRLASALGLAMGLVACGPGTGGTGTGPSIGSHLAQGSYGAALDPSLLPAQPLPCGSQCGGQLTLAISDTRVELNLPCQRFVYEGGWSFDEQGQVELSGRWQRLAVVGATTVLQEQSARLTLVSTLPDAQGLRLVLTLTDQNGASLLGPVTLAQQPQGSAAISCLLSYEYK